MPQTLPQPPITVEELVAMGRQPYLGYGGSLPQSEREKVRALPCGAPGWSAWRKAACAAFRAASASLPFYAFAGAGRAHCAAGRAHR